jgi:hypothetical protein
MSTDLETMMSVATERYIAEQEARLAEFRESHAHLFITPKPDAETRDVIVPAEDIRVGDVVNVAGGIVVLDVQPAATSTGQERVKVSIGTYDGVMGVATLTLGRDVLCYSQEVTA